jgi:mono/diheme cytochrome c family protein
MKRALSILAALAILGALTAAAVVYGGLYDISATDQHLAPTYKMLDVAMRRSVQQRADEIALPPLEGPATIGRGLALFRQHCVQCHGAPGVAPEPFALGLTPAAANLVHTGRTWTPAEIYWVVKNGLKMTGMPAWEYRMPERDLWAVVAFVRTLPSLSPQQYRAMGVAGDAPARRSEAPLGPPDAQRGKTALLQYACATCHHIPGVVGADAPVGPPLDGMGTRTLVAGMLPNTPENMVRWLRFPQQLNPLGAMPDLGVTERDAHDMAAYLASLR